MTNESHSASIFIDFENIFYFLKNQEPTSEDVTGDITELLRNLRTHLQSTYTEHIISMDAYADFERIDENAQGVLYLTGVETHNILGTEHKNAADMKLCIDVIEMLHSRQDISTFILLAGDRDYIPVIQHLKKKGKTVRVVGFPKSTSGDLLTIVGSEYFVDATTFLPKSRAIPKSLIAKPQPAVKPGVAKTVHVQQPRAVLPEADYRPFRANDYFEPLIEVMLTDFRDKKEIWLMPFLHKLRAKLPELTEQERKTILTALTDSQAITVEKRPGTPNDYSVILVNWNNPIIQQHNA